MSRNNHFIAVEETDGKYWAFVIAIPESNNLAGKFDKYKSVNLFATKKRSEEIARAWNRGWKEQGIALF